MGHIHNARLSQNAGAVGDVAAHNNRIGVQGLGQLDRTGARGVKTLRQPEVIQGVHAVRAAHGGEARRSKAAADNLRRGLANPLQAGLPGAVVKGQNQHDAAAALRGGAGLRSRLGAGRNRDGEDQRKGQSERGSQPPSQA